MSDKNTVQVNGHHDLPLHCPNGKTPNWNLHPRVYLDVTATGQAKCPYCGTEYALIPGTAPHGH